MICRAVKVFLSYAATSKDDVLRVELVKHLATLEQEGIITGWSSQEILAGEEINQEVQRRLEEADIILLLVSADLIASGDLWEKQINKALSRHESGVAQVIPIILRPVDWETTPFGKLKPLPSQGIAITSWPNQDEAFREIAQGIRGAAHSLRQLAPFPSPASQHRRWHRVFRQGGYVLRLSKSIFYPSFFTTLGVFILRVGGTFQALELQHYDWMLRSNFNAKNFDTRLFIISITESDYQKHYSDSNRKGSSVFLPDNYLKDILEKLTRNPKSQPRLIGLDVARPEPTKDSFLVTLLQQTENLITVCSLPGNEHQGTAPIPEISDSSTAEKRIAFSDVYLDKDDIVRRFVMLEGKKGDCAASESFALKLATSYLRQDGYLYSPPSQADPSAPLQIGDVAFQRLGFSSGGYQRSLSSIEDLPYEVLINYRNTVDGGIKKIADSVSVEEFLNTEIDANRIKDKIVLIGATDVANAGDEQDTPFGNTYGVILHAHLTSYILDVVKGIRSQIWWPSIYMDTLLILVSSSLSGLIIIMFKSLKKVIVFTLLTLLSLTLTYLLLFWWYYVWLPFIPSAIGFLTTGTIILLKKKEPV